MLGVVGVGYATASLGWRHPSGASQLSLWTSCASPIPTASLSTQHWVSMCESKRMLGCFQSLPVFGAAPRVLSRTWCRAKVDGGFPCTQAVFAQQSTAELAPGYAWRALVSGTILNWDAWCQSAPLAASVLWGWLWGWLWG